MRGRNREAEGKESLRDRNLKEYERNRGNAK